MTDTTPLPEPLVPADVDLRDFSHMPLHVQRLRDSDLASDETPESCWAAVLLWCAAWHQVPAASIPDNEQWQAKTAGYVSRGRIDQAWAKVRAGALRGFVPCSDGRLYHPVVAETALSSWRAKLEQRWRTECGRIKKHNQRHGLSLPLPEFETWLSLGCPQGHALPVPGTEAGQVGEVPGKRTPREEKGREGNKKKTPNPLEGAGRFDEFWSVWPKSPRKGGKPDCLKVWQSKSLEAEADVILAHVRSLSATEGWTKQGGEFVPAPAVYLRGRRWDGAELPGVNGAAPGPWAPGHEPWAGAH